MANDHTERARDADGLHRRRGVWYYTLTIDGTRRFFSTRSRNYQEARKARNEAVKAQLENRLPNDASKWKFETLLAQVLENRKPHLAENSQRIERERSGPLLKFFRGRRVCEIDAVKIRDYQNARAKRVSPRTVNLECKVLRQILREARTWGTVCDGFKPLKEDRRGPGRALEPAQEKLLFDTARSRPDAEVAFYAALIAASTGARGCEIKSLRLRDVDLQNREATVSRSKTEAGYRRIPLNASALWAFARLLERAAAFGSVNPEHFLLPAKAGNGFDATKHQKTFRTAWRALVKATAKRAGNEAAERASKSGADPEAARRSAEKPFEGLRFHDLRHLAITKLAEGEASDQTIMSIAGHLNRSMLEHYSHIRDAAKRKAVEAIQSWLPEEERPAITETLQ